MSSPTGIQVHLSHAGVRAQISQVGAALRALTVDDTVIVPPFPEDDPAPGCAGVVLVPWPNRIRDGLWDDRGTPRQLAITEPKYGNASHGLLRFAPYEIEQDSDASATLRATIYPQTGYPYLVDTVVTYALTDDGIRVTHTLTNRSDADAPVALGTHPYFTIGNADPRDLVLRVRARARLETDERMLPVNVVPADLALHEGVRLGDVELDTGFGDLIRGDDDLIRHSLTAPDGRTVSVWQDPNFGYAQVYTTTGFPGQELAVAIEPMTAPADAFNSGEGLRYLAPDETWTLGWGVAFTQP